MSHKTSKQQNMLNQLMSHKTSKQKQNKRASTEHAKSAYVT